jgi:predicted MFS family arabinose efflux permease
MKTAGTLHYQSFRRLLAAKFLSGLASLMQTVAAGWYVFHITGSAAAVGFLGVLALGPALVGAPLGGLLADRHCPRRLSLLFSLLSAVGPFLLAVAAFSGNLTLPVIYVGVLLSALPQAVAQPITQLVIPYAVPPALRHRAVTDLSAGYGASQLLGALLGGVVVQFAGPGPAFLLNAVSYLVNAWVYRRSPELQASCDMARVDRSATLRSGIAVGWTYSIVRLVALGAVAFFAFVAPLQQLMPKLAAARSGEAMLLGVLLGALSVGSLLANQVVRRWDMSSVVEGRVMLIGLLLACLGSFVLSRQAGVAQDLLCLLAIGFAWELVYVSGRTAMQLEVPAVLSGRLVGVFFLLVSVATAAGSLVMGWLFDALGVDATLVLAAALTGISAAALAWDRRGVRYTMPAPSMADLPAGQVPLNAH